MGEMSTEVRENKMNEGRSRKATTTSSSLAGTGGRLSIPYQVCSDLGVINPWTVKTQEDEENYYKSLLYGCRECDRIEPSLKFMLCHRCSHNGKSKYEQHQLEALERKRKLEHKVGINEMEQEKS